MAIETPPNGVLDFAKTLGLLSPIFLGGAKQTPGSSTSAGTGSQTEKSVTTGSISPEAQNYTESILSALFPQMTGTAGTDKIVDNIMRKAAIAFAPVVGAQNQAGMYNTTVLAQMAGEAQASAVGASASAVLEAQQKAAQTAASVISHYTDASKGTTTDSAATKTQSTSGTNTSSVAKPLINSNITAALTAAALGKSLLSGTGIGSGIAGGLKKAWSLLNGGEEEMVADAGGVVAGSEEAMGGSVAMHGGVDAASGMNTGAADLLDPATGTLGTGTEATAVSNEAAANLTSFDLGGGTTAADQAAVSITAPSSGITGQVATDEAIMQSLAPEASASAGSSAISAGDTAASIEAADVAAGTSGLDASLAGATVTPLDAGAGGLGADYGISAGAGSSLDASLAGETVTPLGTGAGGLGADYGVELGMGSSLDASLAGATTTETGIGAGGLGADYGAAAAEGGTSLGASSFALPAAFMIAANALGEWWSAGDKPYAGDWRYGDIGNDTFGAYNVNDPSQTRTWAEHNAAQGFPDTPVPGGTGKWSDYVALANQPDYGYQWDYGGG